MKRIVLILMLSSFGLFANDKLNIDEQVLRTYQYMTGTKTFHYNGKIIQFPKFGTTSSCINPLVLSEKTIKLVEQLKPYIINKHSSDCKFDENGTIGYLMAKKVGISEAYVFSSLKILE